MACLYTKLRRNPKYKPNIKNGGKPPKPKDNRLIWIYTNCGRCRECRKTKTIEWKQRLEWEIKTQNKLKIKGNFVTMTFTDKALIMLEKKVNGKIIKSLNKDESEKNRIKQLNKLSGYNLDNEIATEAVKIWREKYRYIQSKKPKEDQHTLRYFIITEIAEENTERLHLHAIVWTNNQKEMLESWKWGKIELGSRDYNGNITNYVNHETIGYIIKYYTKPNQKHKYYKPKVLVSQKMGDGYLTSHNAKNNEYKGEETNLTTRTRTGQKIYIGKHNKDRLYTEEQRENLNIFQLDKKIEYLAGHKIDTSTEKGKENYKRLLNAERQKAKRHGHPDNTIDHQQKMEAQNRRNKISHIRKKNNKK